MDSFKLTLLLSCWSLIFIYIYREVRIYRLKRGYKEGTATMLDKLLSLDVLKTLFSIGGLLFLIFFIALNIYPAFAQKISPLTCMNTAFISYLSLFYLIKHLWRKYIQHLVGFRSYAFWAVFWGVIIWTLHAAQFNLSRHNEVTYIENEYKIDERQAFEDYFHQWFKEREAFIKTFVDKKGYFPLVITSAEGGGSRAAYWSIINQSLIEKETANTYFDKHLFSLTGASGGTTGNSMFYAMKSQQTNYADSLLTLHAKNIFNNNFLSSSVVLFLGKDFFVNTFGISYFKVRNRAKILESEWARSFYENTDSLDYNKSFLSYWYRKDMTLKKKINPILLINTTNVQSGSHAIVSPVKMAPAFYKGFDLLKMVDSLKQKTLTINTANLLNASFPLINPAGKVTDLGQFADAGYFDNYGAFSAIGVANHLREIINNSQNATEQNSADSLIQKIKIVSLLIRNGTVDQDSTKTKDELVNQLLIPGVTYMGLRSGYGKTLKNMLQNTVDTSFQINLEKTKIKLPDSADSITPNIPLARYLSTPSIMAMDNCRNILYDKPNSGLKGVIDYIKE